MDSKIHIIGTSHVSKDSIEEVTNYIKEKKPDIIAVELDARRAHALFHKPESKISIKMIKVIGVKGFLFYSLANFVQKKIGRIIGIQPGSEMKTAIIEGLREKKEIALIDQDVRKTLKRLSEEITWKEKLRFLKDLVRNPLYPELKKMKKIDLRKIPSEELVLMVINYLKKRYPNVYKVLIEERNEHMVSALSKIAKKRPESKIVAVVGAGHEEGMWKRLSQEKLL